MKALVLLSLLVGYQQLLWAQACPKEAVILSRQDQIDQFDYRYPSCSQLPGALIIQEESPGAIQSLAGLRQVLSVGGDLIIRGNAALLHLNGLENISSIGGHLRIEHNDGLLTLEALGQVRSIKGELCLVNNRMLRTLNGLERIDPNSITTLRIEDSPQLSVCTVQSICSFFDYGKPARIDNNAQGCQSENTIRTGCLTQIPTLKLAIFNVQKWEDRAMLRWITTTEVNNVGFEIQRSGDGQDWKAIGWQAGQGTVYNDCHYQFTDHHPRHGTNYYRLKQVDYDGLARYTDIVTLLVEREETVEFYPNPVVDRLTVRGRDLSRVSIANQMGTIIYESALLQPEIDLSALPPGIYYIQAESSEQQVISKIIKV